MKRPGQKGAAAAVLVVFFPVFLGLVALLVDVGWLFRARLAMQTAADMGALAGVQQLDLEKLAEGELELTPAAADEADRIWRANLDEFWQGRVAAKGIVEIHNPKGYSRDRISGRRHETPTVCLSIESRVPVPLPLPALTQGLIRVHADASVQEK